MRRYKTFWGLVLVLCFLFPVFFLIQHRGIEQMGFQGVEFLRQYLGTGTGYNSALQHGFLYVAMELLLVLQILPRINQQRLVRLTRTRHWRGIWEIMTFSAFIFCLVFSLVQFVMTAVCIPDERLWESGFIQISLLNFLRLFGVYMIFNGVFAVLYSVFFKEEIAAVICVLFFMVLFYVIYSRWELSAFNLKNDMAVYDDYYSPEGLDLFQYVMITVKHLLLVAILYMVSLAVFEKKDILYGKR